MIDALSESYQSFPAGRLRNALSEFSTTIYFNGSFDKSLEELNKKFDNGFIDSLCIIFATSPGIWTGDGTTAGYIPKQITDMQASLQLKKERKTQPNNYILSDGHYGRNDRCSPVCCYHTDVCVGRVFLIHVTTNILKNRRNENEDENGKNAAESNGTGPEGIFITRAGDSMESWLRWACALSHCYYA